MSVANGGNVAACRNRRCGNRRFMRVSPEVTRHGEVEPAADSVAASESRMVVVSDVRSVPKKQAATRFRGPAAEQLPFDSAPNLLVHEMSTGQWLSDLSTPSLNAGLACNPTVGRIPAAKSDIRISDLETCGPWLASHTPRLEFSSQRGHVRAQWSGVVGDCSGGDED